MSIKQPPRQEIHRVYLAPHRTLGDWTVGDLQDFLEDCNRAGIGRDARLLRDNGEAYSFAETRLFYAERTIDLPSSQCLDPAKGG